MKALSMFWIILGHTALLTNLVGESDPALLGGWEFKSGKHSFAGRTRFCPHFFRCLQA